MVRSTPITARATCVGCGNGMWRGRVVDTLAALGTQTGVITTDSKVARMKFHRDEGSFTAQSMVQVDTFNTIVRNAMAPSR